MQFKSRGLAYIPISSSYTPFGYPYTPPLSFIFYYPILRGTLDGYIKKTIMGFTA